MKNSIHEDRTQSNPQLLLDLDEDGDGEDAKRTSAVFDTTSSGGTASSAEKIKVFVPDTGPLSQNVRKALRHRKNKRFVACETIEHNGLNILTIEDGETHKRYLQSICTDDRTTCVLLVGLHSHSSLIFQASRMMFSSDVLFASKNLRIDVQELVFRMIRLLKYMRACQHSKVLRDILPAHIISRLRQGVHSMYKKHDNVAVLFSDIVGYTDMAGTWSPHIVLSMLHNMFATFDTICLKYDVFKVETIGDSYMACVEYKETSAVRAIFQTALEMMRYVETHMRDAFPSQVRIRIGIHSGPAYSGVVGLIRPRFCYFGDTVNTASRMESTADTGGIQISDAFYNDLLCSVGTVDEIAKQLNIQLVQGQKKIKGKGDMVVHTVVQSLNETPSSTQ